MQLNSVDEMIDSCLVPAPKEKILARLDRQREQSYSSSGSSSYDYVMITFESVCGLIGCTEKNLHISGGPGNFSPTYSGANFGSINKGYNGGLAGRYSWSAQFDNEFCSGSFYVSGSKRNISLSIHKRL